jgi:hypothetical protein
MRGDGVEQQAVADVIRRDCAGFHHPRPEVQHDRGRHGDDRQVRGGCVLAFDLAGQVLEFRFFNRIHGDPVRVRFFVAFF